MNCHPIEIRMRILGPNETQEIFHPPIKEDDNPHELWDCRIHPPPYLGYLDEVS